MKSTINFTFSVTVIPAITPATIVSQRGAIQRGELPRLMEQVRGVNMKRIIDLCVSSVMFSSAPLWLSGAFFIWADYVGL